MLPLWVILGLGGVFFSVCGTLIDKFLLEKYFNSDDHSGPGALIIFSTLFSVVVALIVVAFRYDAIDLGQDAATVGLLSGALYGVWLLMYLHAMTRADVSKVAPLFQTVPIFGLIFGAVILGEFLTSEQIFAAAIIVTGAIILMYQRANGRIGLDMITLALMLGASCFVALTQVVFKLVAVDANYWTAAFWQCIGYTLFGLGLFALSPGYRAQFLYLFGRRKSHILAVSTANEVFDNIGDLVTLAAVVLGPVALVQSLGAYEPMLIFLFCMLLMRLWPRYFNEDVSTSALIQKSCGIAVIFVGSFVLYTTL